MPFLICNCHFLVAPLLGGYNSKKWDIVMNSLNAGRVMFTFFMYLLMIPFFSIIYSRRNDIADGEEDLYTASVKSTMASIIVLTCKIPFDIH